MFTVKITPFSDHIQQKQEWINVASETYKTKLAIRELKQKELQLMDSLKKLSKNVSSKGGGFVFSKTVNKGRVQYGKIPVLQDMDLDAYRGLSTESWKIERK